MPAPKGIIRLSEARDYPLLRQILHSGLATYSQLYEFMKLDSCTSSQKELTQRLRRLVDHGMILRHELRTLNRIVYSLSPVGGSEMIGRGESYARQPTTLAGLTAKVHHALELNEIHLALKRSGMLVRWTSECEIRSRNELTRIGYAKDYDALIAVRIDGRECSFALEYERTPKYKQRYQTIGEKIEQETRVHHFLYLLPNRDLLMFVLNRFSGCKRAVHFGVRRDFLAETLNLQVQSSQSPISMMLRTVLSGGLQTGQPEQSQPAPALGS